ncbi:4-hydroxy-tetrahydrodipicolinate reductase [Litorimonas cladophorae]|uniref:4-hydroxy-tetrahydrodipicolinate reductase n=1 Tax=Litorimonas cladophorae TaxID=1220491 RepID=A0A918KLF4_9PROT|nr:4-hydroxy-tetrahydrodipicolinate reductase [Litorimonas cladophorae]GGX67515.1 4-hydroxy-tetrahydrodipicolinate reductase [Litorimonas cladophorae]
MTHNGKTTNIGILGADGRMGAAVIRAIAEHPNARLTAAVTAPQSTELGRDAGVVSGGSEIGVSLSADLKSALNACDVLIDFSAPKAAIDAALILAGTGHSGRCHAMVSGTTGFTKTEDAAFEAAANEISLLRSGNFSPGVTALSALVELATEKLGRGWDIEILEMHHRHKVDAPSGTALLLGEAAAKGRGLDLSQSQVLSREGMTGTRRDDDIGFATLRGGGVVGSHEVRLASSLEMITLSHDAFDRSVFARGALSSALWLVDQPKGLYSMRDVLGF